MVCGLGAMHHQISSIQLAWEGVLNIVNVEGRIGCAVAIEFLSFSLLTTGRDTSASVALGGHWAGQYTSSFLFESKYIDVHYFYLSLDVG